MRYAKWPHYPLGHITHLSPTNTNTDTNSDIITDTFTNTGIHCYTNTEQYTDNDIDLNTS